MHVRGLVGDAVICVRRDCMQFHSSIGGEETLCFAAQFFSCRMPPGRTRKREDLRDQHRGDGEPQKFQRRRPVPACEPGFPADAHGGAGSSASYRPRAAGAHDEGSEGCGRPATVQLDAGPEAQQVAPRSARDTSYVSMWALKLEEAKRLAKTTTFVSDSEEEARPRRQV